MAYNILILDPAIWRVWFASQPYKVPTTHTVKEWAEIEKADLAFNLTTFAFKTGLADTFVRAGRDCSYGHEGDSALIEIDWQNQCRGYSNGIINGVVNVNKPFGGSRTRNGIGLTDKGHIIIAQSGHKVTEVTFCNSVNNFVRGRGQKVKAFVLEDGRGSTAEFSTVSRLGFAPESGRPVPNVVCVKRRSELQLTRPIYQGCNGADVEIIQILTGGEECDRNYGPGSAKRSKLMQAALGLPPALCCGIISAYTAKKMGLKSLI